MVGVSEGEIIFRHEELDVTLLVDVEQLGAVHVRTASGWGKAPLHVHARHAEAMFVFEGELALRLEDRVHRIGGETWAFVPPEVVHAFEVTGNEPARFVVLHAPCSGFGDFVRGSAPVFDQRPPPEYATGDPGLVVLRRAGGDSGVGSTEPPKSGGAGFAGARAEAGVGSTEPPKSGGAAGYAGAGAEQGEMMAGRTETRRATLLVEADELTVTEFHYGPGERGASPHVHHSHADAFLVVEGELTFASRDGPFRGSAETLAVFPPDVVHGFDNDGTESARFFNLHMPASGFGDYMRGRNPDFDQHEPPPDGGADPASAVAVRLSG